MKKVSFGGLLALVLMSSPLGIEKASAAPNDLKLGLAPYFAFEFTGENQHGMGGMLYGELGLSEYVGLLATAGYAHHGLGDGPSYDQLHADIGFAFNLDVLVLVPFAHVRMGLTQRGPKETLGVGASLAFGADYLLSENLHLGLATELTAMLSHLESHPPGLRFILRLGWTFLD
ncbi:MAG: hypothetical protein JRF33_18540 [Deltaproteobacteria bacterium]|nr:hypothetical protein [Deltaproteobacteria bacterium]